MPDDPSSQISRFESVDALQRALAANVFTYTSDAKKAAGRSLGTLVELITFYMFRAWGLLDSVALEPSIPEFGNERITHKVEFSLHPVLDQFVLKVPQFTLPLSYAKLWREVAKSDRIPTRLKAKGLAILSSSRLLQNAYVFCKAESGRYVVTVEERKESELVLAFALLHNQPFAIFECKRVGIEEGMKKGPTTIEKAKQGAYVARTVSSLQKIRRRDGSVLGMIERSNGAMEQGPYESLLRKIVDSNDADLLRSFILTVGVVSNHGNWFVQNDPRKEIKVLAQSYDWLLFLTDRGLADFINQLILHPSPEYEPVKAAFLMSYHEKKKRTRFTKRVIDLDADAALRKYFYDNRSQIESWFTVISPEGGTVELLKKELLALKNKDWKAIYGI